MSYAKKGRKIETYTKKKARLGRMYNRCPKIQKKYTLQQWLSKIKEVTPKKG